MNKTEASNRWFKSSYSNNGANCVETRRAATATAMAVRDSKLGDAGDVQAFSAPAWAALVQSLKG